MKSFLVLSVFSTLLLPSAGCHKKNKSPRFKGRLELAGICMNYTIGVLEGDPGAGTLDPDWTDETTGRQYKNVFRLGNPCEFPSTIKPGDEFYFVIDTSKGKDCAVCMAYYPTPAKTLLINVVE